MNKIKGLNERRAAVVAKMKALTADAEQRGDASFTAEEREAFVRREHVKSFFNEETANKMVSAVVAKDPGVKDVETLIRMALSGR